MSRKLDTLFAEKVLGCKVEDGEAVCPNCKGAKVEPEDRGIFSAPVVWTDPDERQGKLVLTGERCHECHGTGIDRGRFSGLRCGCPGRPHNDGIGDDGLKHYSESLDAAWEGVGAIAQRFDRHVRIYATHDGWSVVDFGLGDATAKGTSPASTLVVASLLAVGVPLDEVQRATLDERALAVNRHIRESAAFMDDDE